MKASRTPQLIVLAVTLLLSIGALAVHTGGVDNLFGQAVVCLWLFGVSGAGLTLFLVPKCPLQVLLGLCVALSWTVVVILVWLATFWNLSLSLVFWSIWVLSTLLLLTSGWRLLKTGKHCEVEIHRSVAVILVLGLVLGIYSGLREWAGYGQDIFPLSAYSGRTWAAGTMLQEDPFTGGPSAANNTFSGLLALAAFGAGTHPLEMLTAERAVFAFLLILMFSSIPCLLGFNSWSSVGALGFAIVLLPGQFTGWMALHYQNWALTLALMGILFIVSFLGEGLIWHLWCGLLLTVAGCLLHDFVLFFGCISVALVIISWTGSHFQRWAWRRGLTVALFSFLLLAPLLVTRAAQVQALTSTAEINLQRWSRGSQTEIFGYRIRYFPIGGVEVVQGIPVRSYFPVFPLLLAGAWPVWDLERRKALLALLLWPACVLLLPPLYHGLSEVIGLPTVRRLYSLFSLYEAVLFGGVVTAIGIFRQRRWGRMHYVSIALALGAVVVLRLPGAALHIFSELEYHPPEWSNTNVWAWADAYRPIRLKKGEQPVTVLDAPLLMHQGVTSGLTAQRSVLGHAVVQDEETYRRLASAARALDPFVGLAETLYELDQFNVRYVVLNEQYVPRTSRAKFDRWSDHFRLVHSSQACHIYEYKRQFSQPGDGKDRSEYLPYADILSYAPNVSGAKPSQVPKELQPFQFENGIVLHGCEVVREKSALRVSFWWSHTSAFEPGVEIKDIKEIDETTRLIRRGDSDSYRVCFSLFHVDLYNQGRLKALRRRLLETLGRAPSRLLPCNQMRSMSHSYPHPMIWNDWPQTIFEFWPVRLWKEGEIWREDYRLVIPKNLVPGRYELRIRQGEYPNSASPGQAIAEIAL